MKLLQEDINSMRKWSNKWLLPFHPNKCKFMRIGNCNFVSDGYNMNERISQTNSDKHIGLVIDSKLQFSNHLAEKIDKVNKIVGLIRRTFLSLDEEMFKSL